MHNFSLVGEVFLYFILRVEVVKIQISLQIINRFGKRKGILNTILAVGRNPARSRARPSSHSLSSHPSAAQPKPAFPLMREAASGPAQPARRVPSLTEPVQPARSRRRTRYHSYPHSVLQTEFIPFPKFVVIRHVCFKLEIESRSSPRPLRVDGFPPINRSSSRAN
jgi:hypothetical protein